MMWKALHSNTKPDRDPPELLNLKYQLANLICECGACTKKCRQNNFEKQVQVDRKVLTFDQFIQASDSVTDYSIHPGKELCPSCYITLNLLRGGVSKIMKDEEVATNREMFTSDKETKKTVKSAEKTTSYTKDPVPVYTNVKFCDYISGCSSQIYEGEKKESCPKEKVRFLNVTKDTNTSSSKIDIQPIAIYGECFCLDRYIDSIRPPI